MSILQTAAQSVAVEDAAVVTGITVGTTGEIAVTCTGGPADYDLDETKMVTYATNVSVSSNKAILTNYATLIANSSFAGKSAVWSSTTREWTPT